MQLIKVTLHNIRSIDGRKIAYYRLTYRAGPATFVGRTISASLFHATPRPD